jgi:hypothetical protein
MKSVVKVDAGICGFKTIIRADCEDMQHVELDISSGCEEINKYAAELAECGKIDAFAEIGDELDGLVISKAKPYLHGGCASCIVPAGVYKAMQAAAGFALSKDATITMEQE